MRKPPSGINEMQQLERKKKLHLLEPLLIQQHQPDLNVDGSSTPYCVLTHNGLYDVIQYECLKIASLFFFPTVAFHLFLMMAYA